MNTPSLPPIPATFLQYLKSFGPGLIIVLTWLGAGDIVEVGVAGGNYGYSLMWIIVLALVVRYLFVSLIAKYQLCNQHGEGVLDGLARLHSGYAWGLAVVAIVMGHFYGSYMSRGIGETWVHLTGCGQTWQWASFWSVTALMIVFRPVYRRIEWVFLVLLALLSVSLLGTAIWVGPSPSGIAQGLFAMEMPESKGPFGPLLVAIGMIGAVGGSVMNLAYPYFLDQKGWRGPQYRKVQRYDFLLGIAVMVILDLAIWTLGAEVIHGSGAQVKNLSDLAGLLQKVLGNAGSQLFYLGVFAAVFTSLVGHALGLGYLASHAWLRARAGTEPLKQDYRSHPMYRLTAVWILISPLVWTLPGMPGFITLTLIVNSLQVLLLPFLAAGLWWITADSRFIGKQSMNRWWENLLMGLVFALSLWVSYGSLVSVYENVSQ